MRSLALFALTLSACGSFSDSPATPTVDASSDAGGDGGVPSTPGDDAAPPQDGSTTPVAETIWSDGSGKLSAIAVGGERVIWTDKDNGTLRIARLDGSQVEELGIGGAPSGVVYVAPYVFWSDVGVQGKVTRRHLGASTNTEVHSGDPVLTIAASASRFALVTYTSVVSKDLDGTNVETYPSLTNAFDATFCPSSGQLFFVDSAAAKVFRATGTNAQMVAENETDARNIACAADGTLAWSRPQAQDIRVLAPDGVAPGSQVKNEPGVHSLAADGNAFYWLTEDGRLRKKVGAGVTTVAEGFTPLEERAYTSAIAFSATHVYWLAKGVVMRIQK